MNLSNIILTTKKLRFYERFTDLMITTNTSSELYHKAGPEKIRIASLSWEARTGTGFLGHQTQPLYDGLLSNNLSLNKSDSLLEVVEIPLLHPTSLLLLL